MIVGQDSKPKLLKSVLIGDVWVCSGQSNMEFEMGKSLKANEEAPTANYPMIRHFKVGHKGWILGLRCDHRCKV